MDGLIDIMFTTARDVESAAGAELAIESYVDEIPPAAATQKGVWQFTDPEVLQNKRDTIVAALSQREGVKLIKKSRALYWDAIHEVRIACTLSKRHTKRGTHPYWYAYHPQWDEFLAEGSRTFLVLGCVDASIAFAIPFKVMHSYLDGLNTTTKPDGGRYWHMHLSEVKEGQYALLLPKRGVAISLNEYNIPLTAE